MLHEPNHKTITCRQIPYPLYILYKADFYIAGVSSIELTPFLKVVIVSYTLGRDDSLPRDVYHILVLGKLTPFVKAFIPHMPSTS